MSTICVFTPTYNRAHTLNKLYESLINQTDKDFEWYIVDGNSEDNTIELIQQYKKERLINIRLDINPQRSKYTSIINYAIPNNKSKLIFFVDSDDYLSVDAIKKIKENYNSFDEDDIAGFFFLCGYYKSNYCIKPLVNGDKIHSIHLGIQRNDKIDTCCQVYKTKVLQEYSFPNYNEEFMPESVIWNLIDMDYFIVTVNEVIYYREYQEDGYTKQGRTKFIHSPRGMMEAQKGLMVSKYSLKSSIKACLLFSTYGMFANLSFFNIIKLSPTPIRSTLIFPLSIYFYYRWKND